MRDLIVALGLALAIEGLLFAAFPEAVRRAMAEAAQSPRERMRLVGLVSAVVGILVIALARHLGR
jgi:uncharacterized protein